MIALHRRSTSPSVKLSVVSKIRAQLETTTVSDKGHDNVTSALPKNSRKLKEFQLANKANTKTSSAISKKNNYKKVFKKDPKSSTALKNSSTSSAVVCPLAVHTDDDIVTIGCNDHVYACPENKFNKSITDSSTASNSPNENVRPQLRCSSFSSNTVFQPPQIAPKPSDCHNCFTIDKLFEALKEQKVELSKEYLKDILAPANSQISQLTATVKGLVEMLHKVTVRLNNVEHQLFLQQHRSMQDQQKGFPNANGVSYPSKRNYVYSSHRSREYLFSPTPMNYNNITIAQKNTGCDKKLLPTYADNPVSLRQLSCSSKINTLTYPANDTKALKDLFKTQASNGALENTLFTDDNGQYMMIAGGNFGANGISDIVMGREESPRALHNEFRMLSPANYCISTANRSLPAPLLRKSSSNRQLYRGLQSPEPLSYSNNKTSFSKSVDQAVFSMPQSTQNGFSSSFYSCKSPLPINSQLNGDSSVTRPWTGTGKSMKLLNCSARTTPVPNSAGCSKSGNSLRGSILSPQPVMNDIKSTLKPTSSQRQLLEEMGVGVSCLRSPAEVSKPCRLMCMKNSFRNNADDRMNNVLRYSIDTNDSDPEWLD